MYSSAEPPDDLSAPCWLSSRPYTCLSVTSAQNGCACRHTAPHLHRRHGCRVSMVMSRCPMTTATTKTYGSTDSTASRTSSCSCTFRRREGRLSDGTWCGTLTACRRRATVGRTARDAIARTLADDIGCSAGIQPGGHVGFMPIGPNYMSVCPGLSTNANNNIDYAG